MKLLEMVEAGLVHVPDKETRRRDTAQIAAEADAIEAEENVERLQKKKARLALDKARRRKNKSRKGRRR